MADYRVDELARAAGTTVRNVRAYQDRGLLPPPRREGRVGFYNDAHLARLTLIGRLLDRGFSLSNIAELIAGLEKGHDLGQLMGLEEAVTSPWSDEVPTYMMPQELLDLFGPATSCAVSAATSTASPRASSTWPRSRSSTATATIFRRQKTSRGSRMSCGDCVRWRRWSWTRSSRGLWNATRKKRSA